MKNNLVCIVPKKLFLVVLPFLLITTGVFAQDLMVGSAKRILTPNPLIAVSGGVGMPQPATIKKGDLYARGQIEKTCERNTTREHNDRGYPYA